MIKYTINNMAHLLSGGAAGADTAWSLEAMKYGHKPVNFVSSIPSVSKSILPRDNYYKLTQEQLNLADQKVEQANIYLRRKFPTQKQWLDNLLRRNYYQIQTSDALYAVGFLEPNGSAVGGTAWTVQMFIMERTGKAYFFDQNRKSWFVKIGLDPNYLDENLTQDQLFNLKWLKILKPPVPSGTYTGIGSRDIQDSGIRAIKDVYIQ